jgi:hypothetical protein
MARPMRTLAAILARLLESVNAVAYAVATSWRFPWGMSCIGGVKPAVFVPTFAKTCHVRPTAGENRTSPARNISALLPIGRPWDSRPNGPSAIPQ